MRRNWFQESCSHIVSKKSVLIWDISILKSKNEKAVIASFKIEWKFFVPTPLDGGRNYILNWDFFVHTILADRYIHRRELWVLSLKNPSSLAYWITKIFWISFSRAIYQSLIFCEHTGWFALFLFTFPEVL